MLQPHGHSVAFHPSLAAQARGPWAITPDGLRSTVEVMASASANARALLAETGDRLRARDIHRAAGRRFLNGDRSAAPHAIWAWDDIGFESAYDAHIRPSGVGVLPVRGALFTRAAWCWEGYDTLTASGRSMIALGVTRIVMPIGSPGGACQGLTEFCAEIRAWIEAGIEVYAVADQEACSAAYAIMAQALAAYVGFSALIGHIGTWSDWLDISQWLLRDGIRHGYISEGDLKTFFASDDTETPQDEQARRREAQMRPILEHFYGLFLDDVAAGRGDRLSREAAQRTEARIYPGLTSIEAGLADGQATLETLLQALEDDDLSALEVA